jgi:hypothetical protein
MRIQHGLYLSIFKNPLGTIIIILGIITIIIMLEIILILEHFMFS